MVDSDQQVANKELSLSGSTHNQANVLYVPRVANTNILEPGTYTAACQAPDPWEEDDFFTYATPHISPADTFGP